MCAQAISSADEQAARRILGLPPLREQDDPAREPMAPSVFAGAEPVNWKPSGAPLRSYRVPSKSRPLDYWTVEERPDTKHGGTYLYCNCPAWPYRQAQPDKACSHVRIARERWGI